jgi:hypothetical protein
MFEGSYEGLADWLANGPTPDFDALLGVKEINEIAGRWVLLDGYVAVDDPDRGFEMRTWIRGLLVQISDVDQLREKFSASEHPGSEIPNSPEDYYVFGGEIGRSPRYAPSLLLPDGTYDRQIASAFDEYRWIPESTDDGKRDAPQGPEIVEKKDGTIALRFEFPRGRSEHLPGISVELPARSFSWESYHSRLNEFRGFDVLAPSLIDRLKLHTRNREVDFYDSSDKAATAYRESEESDSGLRFNLLYIREDLIRAYLQEGQTLVWCVWGERDYSHPDTRSNLEIPENIAGVLQAHGHVHKNFVQFTPTAD